MQELEVEDRKWLPKKEMREDGDEDEDDDKPLMDISETKKCYVYGQCQVTKIYSYCNHFALIPP